MSINVQVIRASDKNVIYEGVISRYLVRALSLMGYSDLKENRQLLVSVGETDNQHVFIELCNQLELPGPIVPRKDHESAALRNQIELIKAVRELEAMRRILTSNDKVIVRWG